MKKPVARIIANEISQHVNRVFLFPGGTIAPLFDELLRYGVELFVTRNEQGAGYAAIGVAKQTGQTQVVMVTSGPGVTNVATVVADAYFDSVPLVVICGQVGEADKAPEGVRQRGFQEVDTVALMTPIAKQVIRLSNADASNVRANIKIAMHDAASGRPGPIVIDAPMNVLRMKVDDKPVVIEHEDRAMTDKGVDSIAGLIGKSKRPVIIAGQGVILGDAVAELRLLSHMCNIPVSTSMLGIGAMPTDDPLYLGFHGHTGSQVSGKAIYNSDLLIVVGSRLDVRQTGGLFDEFAPNAEIVRIDVDETEMQSSRVKCNFAMHADAKWALGQIMDRVLEGGQHTVDRSTWLAQIGEWRKSVSYFTPYPEKPPLFPWTVIEVLDSVTRAIPEQVIITTGVGQHQSWAARHFTYDYPKRVLMTSGGHGAMGYDIPVAIGAQLANPTALVVCIVGDGSFHMNTQELVTIVERGLPIKIIVLDNERLGMVSQFQKLTWKHDPTTGSTWSPPFMRIATAYGINYMYSLEGISAPALVRMAVINLLEAAGPALLHVPIRKDIDISPMLLAGQRIDQMWWSKWDVERGHRPQVEV